MNRVCDMRTVRLFCMACLCALLIFGLAQSSDAKTGYGEVIDLPNATHAADPSVIRVGDTYYMYPTSTSLAVECWSSKDMESWSYEGVVWEPSSPDGWNNQLIWAPDVFPYEEKYYLYYSANLLIGVAVADEPTGPFVDVYSHPFIGDGYGNMASTAIDANAFLDDDGSLYIYCSCHTSIGSLPAAAICVSPMTDPVTVTGDWQRAPMPGLNWETLWNEGPWTFKHGDTYYLMYSGSGANTPFYAIGYATAKDPLGPFEKYFWNPILKTDWGAEFYGPGHNSVVKDENGTMWIFYHTKTTPELSWDRRVRKNKLAVDDEGDLYVVLNETDDDSGDDDAADDDAADDDAQSDDDEEVGCGC